MGNRFSTYCFKNSMGNERITEITMAYFIPPEIEIAVPRSHHSEMNPSVVICFVYVDHLSGGLRFRLFPLLINLFNHYNISLT